MTGKRNANGMVFNFVKCPQQELGGNSCGAFACAFAYSVVKNSSLNPDVNEKDLEFFEINRVRYARLAAEYNNEQYSDLSEPK